MAWTDGITEVYTRVEELEEENREQKADVEKLKAENDDLFYKLVGVMWFVDKWLDGEELEQDELNRAITMREKTLQITEDQQAEIERLKEANQSLVEAGERLIVARKLVKIEAYKEIITELKKHMCSYDLPDYHSFEAVDEDTMDEVLKEMVGE